MLAVLTPVCACLLCAHHACMPDPLDEHLHALISADSQVSAEGSPSLLRVWCVGACAHASTPPQHTACTAVSAWGRRHGCSSWLACQCCRPVKAGAPTAAAAARVPAMQSCGADSAHVSLCRRARPHGPVCPAGQAAEGCRNGGASDVPDQCQLRALQGRARRQHTADCPAVCQEQRRQRRRQVQGRIDAKLRRSLNVVGCSVLLGVCRTCFGSKRHPADLHACCVCCCRQPPSRRTSPAAAPGHPWTAAPRACHLHLR